MLDRNGPSLLGHVAGAVVWVTSRAVGVSSPRTPGAVLGAGAIVHFALFALASEQFREGSARTLQDLVRTLGVVRPS